MILDAVALGLLGAPEPLYRRRQRRLVLTADRTEAARLLANDTGHADEMDMSIAVPRIAETYSAVVTRQGLIADSDGKIWEVAPGNPGLATSGRGDVGAGAVAGSLVRKAAPAQAGCRATDLHATAGDRLAAAVGPVSSLPGYCWTQCRRCWQHLPRSCNKDCSVTRTVQLQGLFSYKDCSVTRTVQLQGQRQSQARC